MISRSTLVVHDVVGDFIDDDLALIPVLQNIRTVVDAARAAGLPIVFATPDRGTPGCEVPPSVGILPGDSVVRKPRYGAIFGTTLADDLRAHGHDTIVICGISLAGGVETTVRDAFNRDLRSIVVADACLCRPVPDQGWGEVSSADVARVTLSIFAQRFARVITTATLCAELRE